MIYQPKLPLLALLFTNIQTAIVHSITLRELVQLRVIVKLGVLDNSLYLGYIQTKL